MNKSAEALRVEAHEEVKKLWNSVAYFRRDVMPVQPYSLDKAIDLYAAALAVEVAESMHVAGCKCAIGTSLNLSIIEDDPRCSEARARLRGELNRLEGK